MNDKRGTFVLVTVSLSIVALVIAVILQVFVLNPKADSTRVEVRGQGDQLHKVICAQAQSTANAYRYRSLTPSGKVESIRHFLTRMQAQQQTLELAQGLGCKSSPGFPPYNEQISKALRQIGRILGRYTTEQKKPLTALPYGGGGATGLVVPQEIREAIEEEGPDMTGIEGHSGRHHPQNLPPPQVPREDAPPVVVVVPPEEPEEKPLPENLLPAVVPPLSTENCLEIHAALSACASTYEEGKTDVKVEISP